MLESLQLVDVLSASDHVVAWRLGSCRLIFLFAYYDFFSRTIPSKKIWESAQRAANDLPQSMSIVQSVS
jgi:hypothetical protein